MTNTEEQTRQKTGGISASLNFIKYQWLYHCYKVRRQAPLLIPKFPIAKVDTVNYCQCFILG